MDKDGMVDVPLSKVRRSGWVYSIFERIASDTTFHLAYGTLFQAKYITDLPGEAKLLDNPERNKARQQTLLCAALTHALPFVEDLPVRKLLTMRKEMADSFEQYRLTLTGIVRDYSSKRNVSKAQARQIYADILRPKLVKLEREAKVERDRLAKKSAMTVGLSSVILALGVMGLLTQTQIMTLIGGATAFKMAENLGETQASESKVAADDLYFLLKLKRANKRYRR